MIYGDIRDWLGSAPKFKKSIKKNNFLGAKDSLQYIGICIAASERQE